jgi:hypothetical protein
MMPTPDRALQVMAISVDIGVDASDDLHLGNAYLLVHGDRQDVDTAVHRLEPRAAQITDPLG